MNGENQLIIDFRDYRRDGKGRRVKSSSLSVFLLYRKFLVNHELCKQIAPQKQGTTNRR